MNRISERFLPDPRADAADDRLLIREQLLTIILMGAALLGAIAYFINLRVVIQEGTWGWGILYTFAFVWTCVIAFVRRIPYNFRAMSLAIVLFALGIVSALQYGAAGDSRIWLLGAAVMAGIFMGLRTGIISIIVDALAYVAIGWAMQNGILNPPAPSITLTPENLAGWTTTAFTFFGIGIILIISVGVLINGLNNSIRKNKTLADELAFDKRRLERRSQALERRELQVRTAAEISRTVTAELDPDAIFQSVVDLVQSRFNLYYVGAFTVDPSGHYAVLRAGTGEAGAKMLGDQHRLAIGTTSMIGYAISQREAHTASDVGLDAHHFDNPSLPLTRSELALPMIASGRVLGAISVQSVESDAFDADDIMVYQGVADSLATALINANLFQQVQSSLEEVQTLHRQYLLESWGNVTAQSNALKHTYEPEAQSSEEMGETILPPTSLDLPLTLRGQAIGNLTVEAARNALSPQEHAFIEAVTQQTALALENIRLVEETQRSAQQDQIINIISEELSRAMDVESVLKAAVRELGRLPNVSEVAVHIEPYADDN